MKDSSAAAARIYYIITIDITLIRDTLCCTSLFQGYCHVRSQEKSCLIIRYEKKQVWTVWSQIFLKHDQVCDYFQVVSAIPKQTNKEIHLSSLKMQQINK